MFQKKKKYIFISHKNTTLVVIHYYSFSLHYYTPLDIITSVILILLSLECIIILWFNVQTCDFHNIMPYNNVLLCLVIIFMIKLLFLLPLIILIMVNLCIIYPRVIYDSTRLHQIKIVSCAVCSEHSDYETHNIMHRLQILHYCVVINSNVIDNNPIFYCIVQFYFCRILTLWQSTKVWFKKPVYAFKTWSRLQLKVIGNQGRIGIIFWLGKIIWTGLLYIILSNIIYKNNYYWWFFFGQWNGSNTIYNCKI